LNTGDGEIESNLGLKDQVIALKWVKKYIGLFDGNNELVTLCGHGLGASFVHYHMLSPMSKGKDKHQDFHWKINFTGSFI